MASKPVAMLLADLGVTKTHSRPHCPNDNPFSEAQFKTMEYRPEFPDRFGGPEDARVFCTAYATHPERFVRKPPQPPRLPVAAWINKPQEEVTTAQ
jgi:putative transposase